MVLPVIGVEFPEEVVRAEVATLLEACDHAFLEGECGEADPARESAGEYELTAVVVWLGPTEARVTLRRPADDAFDSEDVSFSPEDDPLERYRALGFAIGTLGSGFVREPEQPSTPVAEPIPLLDVPKPEVRDVEDPPDPIPDAAVEGPAEPLPKQLTRYQLEAAFVGGNGIGSPRFGGELSVWAPVYRRWVSQWSLGHAVQPRSADGLDASFWLVNVGIGPRFVIDRASMAATVGIQAQGLSISLGEAELGRRRPALGPLMALHARLLGSSLSPFIGARIAYLSETPIALEQVDSDGNPIAESRREIDRHGPWQLEAALGASFAFGP